MIANTKLANIDVKLFIDNQDLTSLDKNFYRLIAFDKNENEMGYINFSTKNREVWIWKIEVFEKYQNNGIGQALMDITEYFTCVDCGCKIIEGKFVPSNAFAEHFYRKNGFSIFEDDYSEFLYKTFDKKLILQKPFPVLGDKIEVLDYSSFRKEKEANEIIKELKNKKEQNTNITL